MSNPGDEESESAAAGSAGEISRTYRVWIARDAVTDRYVVPIEADPTATGRYRCCACDCPLLVRPCSVGGQHFAHRRGEGRLCRGPSAAHRQAVAFVVHWFDQHVRGARTLALELLCGACDATGQIPCTFPVGSSVVMTADPSAATAYDVEVRDATGACQLGLRIWWSDRPAWSSPATGVPWIQLTADEILDQVLRDQVVQNPTLALQSRVGGMAGDALRTDGAWRCPTCCEAEREKARRAPAPESSPRTALQGSGTGQLSAVQRLANRLRLVQSGRADPVTIMTSVACAECQHAKTITVTADLFQEVVTPAVGGSTFAWDIELRRGHQASSELVLGILVVSGGRPTWLRDPGRTPTGPGRFICLDQPTIDHVIPVSVLENGITYPSRCAHCLNLAAAAAVRQENEAAQERRARALAALKALKRQANTVVLPCAQRDLDNGAGELAKALDAYQSLHDELVTATQALTTSDRQAMVDHGGVSAEVIDGCRRWAPQRISDEASQVRAAALRDRSHEVKVAELAAVHRGLFEREASFRSTLTGLTSQAEFKAACRRAAADTLEDLNAIRSLVSQLHLLGDVPLLGVPDSQQPLVPVKKWLEHFTPQTMPAWWDCEHAQAMDVILLQHEFVVSQVIRLAQHARAEANTVDEQSAADARIRALVSKGLDDVQAPWDAFIADLRARPESDETWDTLGNHRMQSVDALLQVVPLECRPTWVVAALDALHAGPFRMSTHDKRIRLLQIDRERRAGGSVEP